MGAVSRGKRSVEGQRLWDLYHAEWELDSHADVVLGLALEALERLREAQAEIARRGWKPGPKGGQSPFAVERDARRDVAKLLKSIGLELAVAPPDGHANGARGGRR